MTEMLVMGFLDVCVYVCYWKTVSDFCQDYEVAMFQPHTLRTLDLGSVYYCYIY